MEKSSLVSRKATKPPIEKLLSKITQSQFQPSLVLGTSEHKAAVAGGARSWSILVRAVSNPGCFHALAHVACLGTPESVGL